MKITKIISRINVLGKLWYGQIAATTYPLNSFQIESIRTYRDGAFISRDAVEKWLIRNSGDFQEIIDFSVTIGDGEFDSSWEKEESEWMFCDYMYGDNE